jgi:hypothetical protein
LACMAGDICKMPNVTPVIQMADLAARQVPWPRREEQRGGAGAVMSPYARKVDRELSNIINKSTAVARRPPATPRPNEMCGSTQPPSR